ncbi:MAG: cytochrome c-type biogenesis protein [Hyphomonadaceae bacterium]
MSFAVLLAAVVAGPALGDPAQEARVRALETEIRCVQCQNEPIAQSTAEIAADMRRLVRERVAAGDSDAEIRAYFRERYGDFVLFRPPVDSRTWLLWGAPLILLAGGLAAVYATNRRTGASGPLEPEDSER